MRNNQCDGGHCKHAKGRVRLVPYPGGNLILCRDCFAYEMRWRKERNRELGAATSFDLPSWESLQIYGEDC